MFEHHQGFDSASWAWMWVTKQFFWHLWVIYVISATSWEIRQNSTDHPKLATKNIGRVKYHGKYSCLSTHANLKFWLLHLLNNQPRVHIKVGFILAFMGLGWFISIFANCRFMSWSQGSTPSHTFPPSHLEYQRGFKFQVLKKTKRLHVLLNPQPFFIQPHLQNSTQSPTPYFFFRLRSRVFFTDVLPISQSLLILSLKTFNLVMEAFEMSLHIGQGFPVETFFFRTNKNPGVCWERVMWDHPSRPGGFDHQQKSLRVSVAWHFWTHSSWGEHVRR